jgi:hypothetical protein
VSARRPPTDAELDALAELASGLSDRGWRHQETRGLDFFALRDPTGEEVLHLYGRREAGRQVLAALDAARVELPRLVAEVKRLRAALKDAEAGAEAKASARPAPKTAPGPAPAPARERPAEVPVDEDAPLSLAVPFRVGPKEAKAAQTDPLAALAVQVAKALSGDAKELERARLIAMALAASRGDLDAFWAARKMRATGPKAAARKK